MSILRSSFVEPRHGVLLAPANDVTRTAEALPDLVEDGRGRDRFSQMPGQGHPEHSPSTIGALYR
jgi:hypothetical protein